MACGIAPSEPVITELRRLARVPTGNAGHALPHAIEGQGLGKLPGLPLFHGGPGVCPKSCRRCNLASPSLQSHDDDFTLGFRGQEESLPYLTGLLQALLCIMYYRQFLE